MPIWGLTVAAFVNSAGKMVLAFLALYLTKEIGLSVTQIGLIMTAYGIGNVMGSYICGRLCDYIDARTLLVGALVLCGLSIISVAFITAYPVYIAVLFFVGLFDSGFWPSHSILLMRYSEEKERAHIYALHRVATNLGAAMAGVAAGFLWHVDVSLIFWVDGITCLLAAVLVTFLVRDEHYKKASDDDLDSVSEDTILQSPIQDKVFLHLCLVMFVNVLIFFQFRSTYPIYLNEQYAISPQSFGVLFMLNGLLTVLLQVPIARYLQFRDRIISVMLGSVLLASGFVVLPLGHSIYLAWLSCVLITLGELVLFPIVMQMVFRCAETGKQGEYMAIYNAIYSISHVVAPAIGTALYALVGGEGLWLICGFGGLLAVLGFKRISHIAEEQEHITWAHFFDRLLQEVLKIWGRILLVAGKLVRRRGTRGNH